MKTILITAYAVNPYKGSEDAMGWNLLLQAASHQQVIAITRKNNRPAIEKYQAAHPELQDTFNRLTFLYFDCPAWMLWWKKGPLLSMIYYYTWQFLLPLWFLWKQRHRHFDIAHNMNFHNDWTPSFLWLLRKPLVWGHVGHHPKIPKSFLLKTYGVKAYLQDRLLWMIKLAFWYLDPFLWITKRSAARIICMNQEAVKRLRLKHRYIIHPSVAVERPATDREHVDQSFTILSVGRFVPLKGFDLTIRAFAAFYRHLAAGDQLRTKLVLVGKGPCRELLYSIATEEGVVNAISFVEWMPREELLKLYQMAGAFLFPSHEGAGMVVPEAMSYALPVICLDNAGPGTLIHPGSCLKIAYGSYGSTVDRLADRLSLLFRQPGLREMEAMLSLERYHNLFRWEVRGAMLQQVYTAALSENKK